MRTLITPGAGTTKQDPARLDEQTADRTADAALTDRPEPKTRPAPPAAFKRRGRDQAQVPRACSISHSDIYTTAALLKTSIICVESQR